MTGIEASRALLDQVRRAITGREAVFEALHGLLAREDVFKAWSEAAAPPAALLELNLALAGLNAHVGVPLRLLESLTAPPIAPAERDGVA